MTERSVITFRLQLSPSLFPDDATAGIVEVQRSFPRKSPDAIAFLISRPVKLLAKNDCLKRGVCLSKAAATAGRSSCRTGCIVISETTCRQFKAPDYVSGRI